MLADLDMFKYRLATYPEHCDKGALGTSITREIPVGVPFSIKPEPSLGSRDPKSAPPINFSPPRVHHLPVL